MHYELRKEGHKKFKTPGIDVGASAVDAEESERFSRLKLKLDQMSSSQVDRSSNSTLCITSVVRSCTFESSRARFTFGLGGTRKFFQLISAWKRCRLETTAFVSKSLKKILSATSTLKEYIPGITEYIELNLDELLPITISVQSRVNYLVRKAKSAKNGLAPTTAEGFAFFFCIHFDNFYNSCVNAWRGHQLYGLRFDGGIIEACPAPESGTIEKQPR